MSLLARQFDKFFDDPFFDDFDLMIKPRIPRQVARRSGFEIPCDVKETPTHFIITADLPGMKKEDIKMEVRDGMLCIKGEVKQEKEEKGETYHMKERRYGSFERKISLPKTVDWSKVHAEFKDGVLHTSIAKKEEEKTMTIQIQ